MMGLEGFKVGKGLHAACWRWGRWGMENVKWEDGRGIR